MIKLLTTLIILISACAVRAQSVQTTIGARANAIGNTSSCIADEWSLFNNVGGLSRITTSIGAFSYDSRPSLLGANRMAFVFASPIKVGTAGVGLFRFGDNIYSEQIITTGYSNSFGLASLGIKANYVQYRAEGFGNKGLLTISAGGIAQLTPKISIGVHIINLNQQRLSGDTSEKEYIPTLIVAGIGFKGSDKVFIVAEVEKDLSYPAIVKAGLEYQAHKKLAFRSGFNTKPSSGYFGLGFKTSKLKLDYSFRYEPNLGGSHQASVGYIIKSK